MIHELAGLFLDDSSQIHLTNSLAWEELQDRFNDERIKAYFMSLDLDSGSIGKIFDVLDSEDRGIVELDDFLLGCMTYRGSAKAVDVCILQNENTLLMDKLVEICDFLERATGNPRLQ